MVGARGFESPTSCSQRVIRAAGFEPATSCAQGRRSTRLSYALIFNSSILLSYAPRPKALYISDCRLPSAGKKLPGDSGQINQNYFAGLGGGEVQLPFISDARLIVTTQLFAVDRQFAVNHVKESAAARAQRVRQLLSGAQR